MSTDSSNEILTPQFIEHFNNPRNVGIIENPDGYAKVGDQSCGDFIQVWIKINDNIITDYKYKVFGCGGAIATTSVASELAIGKELREAIQLTDDDVIRTLGAVPENKAHCSLLGINGLRAAIADYLVKDNHKKYAERMFKYKQAGYDIQKHRDELVKFLVALPTDAQILDVGTGKGHLALAIARKGWQCVSIDKSEEELHFATLNAVHFRLDNLIKLKEGDAKQIDYPDKTFSAVCCADLIHHVVQPDAVLLEMLRVCQSGGIIAISDLNENGEKIIADILKQDGKEHPVLGWKMEKVKQWFEKKGIKVNMYEKECETFVIAEME